jgi:hypothetical protein
MKTASLLLLLLLTACASTGPRYQIRVGNDHPSLPVKNVEVSVDGKEASAFTQIAAQKTANAKPRSSSPPRVIALSWTDTEGKARSQQVETQALSGDFRGQIALAITPDGDVTLTPVPAVGKEFSPIPWGVPEQWEGSVFLPGMNE